MIQGFFKDKFKYSNMAVAENVHANSDLESELEIKDVICGFVVVWNGKEEFIKKIMRKKDGTEYFVINQAGFYEQVFQNGKPSKTIFVPFLDNENEHEFKPEKEPPKKPKQTKLTISKEQNES